MNNPLDYTITELNKLKPKKGRLLIAEPFMEDPYFKRSVVLLTEYNTDGAFGFMLNKPLEMRINDIMKDFPPFDAPVFMGGPVQPDSLFYVHTQGKFIEGSMKINDSLYWSGNFDQLKQLIKDQQIFPNEIKFFIGYSGWDYEQLSEEIKDESWIISDINSNNIEELNDEDLWQSTLQRMGAEFSLLSNFPEDPSLN
ncbi:MAG: YqgE/AlgH family protein [Flavobacteriales bacterium]|nr:YqgE/AlgH family protein [Flavobacteriales bacterium]